MKFVPLLLLLSIVALLAQPGRTQSQTNQRVSLDIGSVTVWLNMSKAELVKKFSDAGYVTTDLGNGVVVGSARELHDFRFRNGRLVYAEVEWYRGNGEEMDAVLGALGTLADKSKSRPCTMAHQPLSAPDMNLDRLFIFCGDRSVLIASGKVQGKASIDVSERIGDIPEDTQK
jgi:hypothetical protein